MATSDSIDLADRRELFVDHHLIERLEGAQLRMHSPQRQEVVFQVQPPVENGASGVYSAPVAGDEQYLLYYRGRFPLRDGRDEAPEQAATVAVSDDGIHFERPELGIHDLGDGGRNNIIWRGNAGHNFMPFRDRNPDADPDKRFKAVGGVGGRNLHAFYSADGFHWRLAQDEPLDVPGKFDSANVAFWDAVIGKYRLFSRMGQPERGRSIQSCESDDFLNWSEPVPHQYDDGAPVEEFYTNATTLCPGAEHLLLSFPMRYVRERTTPVEDISAMDYPGSDKPGMTGMTDAVMMSSRDGVHWHRPFCEAWLRPGLDERNWTHRNTTPAPGILSLREDEWSMYVSEHYAWPDNRLRRLSIRPWGLASVNAGYAGGEMTTKPFTFTGGELRVNYSTSAVGSLQIELQDAESKPIPGFKLDEMTPIYGDRLDAGVAWQAGGDVSSLSGQVVRLRVRLMDADLFALRFA